MASLSAQLIDELGYDPDDGVPELGELLGLAAGSAPIEVGAALEAAAGAGTLPGGSLARAVAGGDVAAARIGPRRVAVARLGSGKLVVVADECPHDGGRISDGFVEGEHLVCARHGWTLEARNGRCERACKLRE